jgi:hypothetical protein
MYDNRVLAAIMFLGVTLAGCASEPAVETAATEQGVDEAAGGKDVCSAGALECCNTVQAAGSNAVSSLLGLLGIVVADVNTSVGLGCTPIDTPKSCTTFSVCCQNIVFNGLIGIGCSPIQ